MKDTLHIHNKAVQPPKRVRKVPNYLIYEVINGKPFYYKDYKNVLSGKQKFEDIMGSSRIQSFFISLIVEHLLPLINKNYKMFYSEMGVHVSLGNNLSADIAIYDKKALTQEWLFEDKYADKPPKVTVEIDVKIALQNNEDAQKYFTEKTRTYLNFGVEQVVWVFTKTRTIWVAKNDGKPWLIMGWDDKVAILEQTFSINDLIQDYGFDPTQLKMNL